jgi:plasmid stability protein
MADILVRGVDDEVLAKLRDAASAHRRSLQAEIREVLTSASLRSLAETRRLSASWLEALVEQTQGADTTGASRAKPTS